MKRLYRLILLPLIEPPKRRIVLLYAIVARKKRLENGKGVKASIPFPVSLVCKKGPHINPSSALSTIDNRLVSYIGVEKEKDCIPFSSIIRKCERVVSIEGP